MLIIFNGWDQLKYATFSKKKKKIEVYYQSILWNIFGGWGPFSWVYGSNKF